jgi:hypothetical protein
MPCCEVLINHFVDAVDDGIAGGHVTCRRMQEGTMNSLSVGDCVGPPTEDARLMHPFRGGFQQSGGGTTTGTHHHVMSALHCGMTPACSGNQQAPGSLMPAAFKGHRAHPSAGSFPAAPEAAPQAYYTASVHNVLLYSIQYTWQGLH